MVDAFGNGRYRILGTRASGLGPRDSGLGTRVAYAAVDRGRTWVFMEGRTYVIETPDRDGRRMDRRTDDQLALSAPMPATVLAVQVAAGQTVQEGDLLIMLEAMKMEMPIRAPHAGRVKSIACRAGELVQPGIPLLELE